MKPARAKRLALSLGILAGVLLSVSVALLYANGFVTLMSFNHPDGGYDNAFVGGLASTFPEDGASNGYLLAVNFALAATLTPMGVLIAARQPSNSLGWLFCAMGILVGVLGAADQYTVYALLTNPGSLPAPEWTAWVASWVWMPVMNLMFALLPLLFPDGRPPTRRWRAVVWLIAAGMLLITAYLMFLPGSIPGGSTAIENPVGIDGASGFLELCLGAGAVIGWFCVFASAASVAVRLRRSRGRESQQIKWLAYAAAMAALSLLAGTLVRGFGGSDVAGTILQFAALPFLPVAIAAAVLRYRLYDIDIIINKTIVYIALTAFLAVMYFLLVGASEYVFQSLTGSESEVAVVASTLAIAAFFNPLRLRIQTFVDRRFYRGRYDARESVEAFAKRMRDETNLDSLAGDLVGVVGKTMHPDYVSLWMRPPDKTSEIPEKRALVTRPVTSRGRGDPNMEDK